MSRRRPARPVRFWAWLLAGVVVLVFVIAFAIAGCFGGGEDSASTDTPAASETGAAAGTGTSGGAAAEPEAVVPEEGTIEAGDEGAAVEALQQALRDLGFKPGPVDGIFGQRTEKAVKAFQRSVDLPQTGIVNGETARALNNALAGLSSG